MPGKCLAITSEKKVCGNGSHIIKDRQKGMLAKEVVGIYKGATKASGGSSTQRCLYAINKVKVKAKGALWRAGAWRKHVTVTAGRKGKKNKKKKKWKMKELGRKVR